MTDALKPFMPEELPGYFEKPGILEGLAKDHPAAIVRQLANYTLSLRNTRAPDPRIAELEAVLKRIRQGLRNGDSPRDLINEIDDGLAAIKESER